MIKKTVLRSIAVILIASLSVCIGLFADKFFDGIDREKHPREYSDFVAKYSSAYGVPEYIVYAVIKTESDFDSSLVSGDGSVGLMQISESTFTLISELLGEQYELGMLYDPETNIKYGTYYLSYLYGIYARWPTVYAAYNTGTPTVDGWLENPEYSHDGMSLSAIPFDETSRYVESVTDASELYAKFFY